MCCQVPGMSMNLQSIIFAPCFSAYFRTSLGVMRCSPFANNDLDRVLAGLAGADADDLVDGRHEDLAVADPSRLGGLRDRAEDGMNHVVLHDDLELHLR